MLPLAIPPAGVAALVRQGSDTTKKRPLSSDMDRAASCRLMAITADVHPVINTKHYSGFLV
jgi:hypothetical protein